MNVWWLLVVATAVATIVAERIAPYPDPKYWWHALPAFDLVYGWIGCVVIVVVSKALGKLLLQQPEGYTPEEDNHGGHP